MDIFEIFAHNLKKYRSEQKLSQQDIADKTGLNRTYISDVERKKRSISLENIQKIATALNIHPSQLFKE